MSFSSVLRRMIGWNALGESYDSLFSLGITIIVDNLKYNGYEPSSKQALAIFMILLRYASLLIIHLRWHHMSLSGPEVDELLYLVMVFKNSFLEKGGHSSRALLEISWRILMLTWWSCTRLTIKWRVCQRSLISKHRQLLCLIASIAGRFLFLI